MDSGNAIVMFQPNGVVELRPDPSASLALEIRSERGSGRADRHEWHVGDRAASIEIIRYDRGQPVDQHRLSRGDAARVAVPDEHSTLRLRTTGQAGPPKLLEIRLVPRAVPPRQNTQRPNLPKPELIKQRPRTAPPPRRVGATGAPPRTIPPTGAPRSRGTIADLLEAIDRRLKAAFEPIQARLTDIELQLEGRGAMVDDSGIEVADPGARLLEKLDRLERKLDQRPAPADDASPLDMTPLESQLDGLHRELQTLTERLDGLAESRASEASLADALTLQSAAAEARHDALMKALADRKADGEALLETLAEGEAEAKAAATARAAQAEQLAQAAAERAALAERLTKAVEAQTDRLLSGQIDPLALRDAVGEIVRTTQDAGMEPMLVGLDRLEQQQVRQQERFGRLSDQLETLEQAVRGGGDLKAAFEPLRAQVERLEGIIRAPSTDSAKLDQLAIALKRVETGLASGPNVDSRLAVMQSQLGRIEEGAGAITPELLEVLASRLEAVDPRPGFTQVNDKFAALAEALEWVAETVDTKLESRLGEATPLAGRLARLEQAVGDRATSAELGDALAEIGRSLDALLSQQPATAERLDAHADRLGEAQARLTALSEQVAALPDPGPALTSMTEGIGLRLEALGERLGEGSAPLLERLDGLGERLAQAPDPGPALERIEDNLDRLDRRVRSEGNQAERAVTAAMAVVQSLDVSEPLEAIEDRLRRIERTGGGGGGEGAPTDLGPILDRLDALGPDGALVERLADLEARLATLINAAGQADDAPDPVVTLADRFDDIEARLATLVNAAADDAEAADDPVRALVDRFDDVEARLATLVNAAADPSDAPDPLLALTERLGGVEAKLTALAEMGVEVDFGDDEDGADPLAAVTERLAAIEGHLTARAEIDTHPVAPVDDAALQRIVAVEQRLADLADLDLGGKLDGLQATVAPRDDKPLTDRLDALQARLDALPAPSADGNLTARFDALEARLEALSSGGSAAPADQTELLQRLERFESRIEDLVAMPSIEAVPAGPDHGPALQAIQVGLVELATKLERQTGGAGGPAPTRPLMKRLDALSAKLDGMGPGGSAEIGPPVAVLERLDALSARLDAMGPGGSAELAGPPLAVLDRLDALSARVDALAERPAPAADPAVAEQLDALTARLDRLAGQLEAPPAPDGEVTAQLEALSAQVAGLGQALQAAQPARPKTPAPAPVAPRPDVDRRSPDGLMLDQIDLLIDTVHSQHVEQPSVRGLLTQDRLDEVQRKVQALRDSLAEGGAEAAAGVLDPLEARLRDSQSDPLADAQAALIEGEFAEAISGVVQVLKRETQAPLTADNLERLLIGSAKSLWDADPAHLTGPARAALDALLGELEVQVVLPEPNTTWQPKEQRVQARRQGRPGQALNRILEVHAPGFRRGEHVLEKAAVTISD